MKKAMFSILLMVGMLGFFVPFVMVIGFDIDYDALINNGTIAFLICVVSIYMIIGGCVGLYRLSDKFKAALKVLGQCVLWWI